MTTQSECIDECTICLLNYTDETKKITDCSHTFHTECLDKWLQTNYTCPLCRTELKPKNSLHRPIYAVPRPSGIYNSSRVDPFASMLVLPMQGIMVAPGYNVEEDSIVFGREIDEGLRLSLETIRNMPLEIQAQQEQGVTLHRRENAPELRQYQRMMIDYLLSQSHPEMLHSGSTGITRASPFRLNVTYLDEDEEEELTQVMIDDYVFGVARSSMMQNMGEMLHNSLYPNSMTHSAPAGEEVISNGYRYPFIGYGRGITVEEVD